VSLSFLSTLPPKRPDFLATMTLEEKAVMGQHLAYTRQLFDQGKVVPGGAATNGAIGIIVWRVDSAEEMQRIYETGGGAGTFGASPAQALGRSGADGGCDEDDPPPAHHYVSAPSWIR
jgi:hypothetical protein